MALAAVGSRAATEGGPYQSPVGAALRGGPLPFYRPSRSNRRTASRHSSHAAAAYPAAAAAAPRRRGGRAIAGTVAQAGDRRYHRAWRLGRRLDL